MPLSREWGRTFLSWSSYGLPSWEFLYGHLWHRNARESWDLRVLWLIWGTRRHNGNNVLWRCSIRTWMDIPVSFHNVRSYSITINNKLPYLPWLQFPKRFQFPLITGDWQTQVHLSQSHLEILRSCFIYHTVSIFIYMHEEIYVGYGLASKGLKQPHRKIQNCSQSVRYW